MDTMQGRTIAGLVAVGVLSLVMACIPPPRMSSSHEPDGEVEREAGVDALFAPPSLRKPSPAIYEAKIFVWATK